MTNLDWALVVVPIVIVLAVAIYTNRYVRSVADFLSGGRLAGRYLLANARGESDAGLANTMSKFEQLMVAGFVLSFWDKISTPVLLLVGISGFVIYRFRETRALTLAQFFEQRYSRRFRLFMGGLAFVSGILNYGIFPAISARFFIYFLDLPHHFAFGTFTLSTFATIMVVYLSATVFMVLVGGQVTSMVTDCIEGIFSHLIYIVIVLVVFMHIGWSDIVQTMSATPSGKSMINPFDADKVEDFNFIYVMMWLATTVYSTMALQNKQGFNSAAKSPHEARMAYVLGNWRVYARGLMLLSLGLCVATFIRHPDFRDESAAAKARIAMIDADSAVRPSDHDVGSQGWLQDAKTPQLQKQMTAPVALSYLLPSGAKGLFLAIMMMGLIAGDAGHLHSWGSIFVQDVLLPLRKRPMSSPGHILALRLSVTFVAGFALFFSLTYSQGQYIALWMALTAGVFTGGAGVAIIGGLYWRRGTTAGAWSGALTGSILALGGVAMTNKDLWTRIVTLGADKGVALPPKFWLNGQQVAFYSAIIAVTVYVVVSLITSRGRKFDLDAMLHRTPRSSDGSIRSAAAAPGFWSRFRPSSILRFDQNFTRADKLVSGGIFWWSIFLLAVNVVVTTWNLAIDPWPTAWWSAYWLVFGIVLPFVIAVGTLIWFGIGGVLDIRHFYAALRDERRDTTDDGRVPEKRPDIEPVDRPRAHEKTFGESSLTR